MSTLLDAAFIVGAGAAIVVVPLALLAVRATRPARWLALTAYGVGSVVGAAFVGHWVAWWLAFDYVGSEPVPNRLFPATTVLMIVSAVGCLVLTLMAGSRRATRAEHRSPEP